MLRDGIVVRNWLDHLNVELLLTIREPGLEHDKVIAPKTGLKTNPLSERGHLPSSQVNPPLNFPRAVTELEDIRVVLPVEAFQPTHDRDGVKVLPVKH